MCVCGLFIISLAVLAGVHDEELTAAVGIVGSHAYSLLAVYELETSEGPVRCWTV